MVLNGKSISGILGVFVLFSLVLIQCANDNLEDLAKKAADAKSSAGSNSSSASSASGTGTSSGTGSSSGTGTSSGSSSTTSFSKDIQPLLSKYRCPSCHGTYYYNYAGVSSLAASGTLVGTMSGASGYRLMPPGQKASSSDLAIIKAWIAAGEPNN